MSAAEKLPLICYKVTLYLFFKIIYLIINSIFIFGLNSILS